MILIYSIISKMHVQILDIVISRLLVLFSGESGQAFLMDINSERRDTHNYHVYSQVILETVNNMRLCDVLLDHEPICWLQFVRVFGEVDSPALSFGQRLDYEGSLVPVAASFLDKVFVVMGQHIGVREKVELLGKQAVHAHQVPTKGVLPRQLVYPRKMVNPLMRLHLLQKLIRNRHIRPTNIPVSLLLP